MPSWPPKKNAAFTLYAPIYDADGDPVAAAAGLSSTLIQDGGAAVAGPVPVDEGEGIYSVALTVAQMNFDAVVVLIKTTTTGAKTTVVTLYTVARQIDDLAFPNVSGRGIDVDTLGGVEADVARWLAAAPNALVAGRVDASVGAMAAAVVTAAAFAAGAIDAAAVGTGAIDADAIAANALTAAKIATDAVGAAQFAQGAADKVFGTGGATLGELAQAIPPATPRPDQALMALYMSLRNLLQVTATEKRVTNDLGTVIFKKALSDDGTTYAEAEAVAGP